MRKAVVLDKSGTVVDACRFLLDLKSGQYLPCANTLSYVVSKGETLVNVRGSLRSILEGRTSRLSLKVSCAPSHGTIKISCELFLREGVMEGLRGVVRKVRESCGTELGICTALLVHPWGEVSHVVGLGGKLYTDVEGAVRALTVSGADLFLATGNCREASMRCARKLGIPKEFVLYDANPREKMELVSRLRGFYGLVVMVGNDINDLSAMEKADLGIMVRRSPSAGEDDFSGRPEVDYIIPSLIELVGILEPIR